MPETIVVEGIGNREFFERYAAPGRVGLIMGPTWVDRLIARAQRRLTPDRAWSRWSHAFLFQGRRRDGHHWIIESDLDIRPKHIRLGAQENRVEKYCDDAKFPAVAILDFDLTPEQEQQVVVGALGLVAEGARYSLREIAGTSWAMRHPGWRPRENVLAQEKAFYCSAFVRHVFSEAGVELVEGVAKKNTAPEHIALSTRPHAKWILARGAAPASRLQPLVRRLRTRRKQRD